MDRLSGGFVWNTEKEGINVRKHGVDFHTAAEAFLDPERKIYGEKGGNTMKKRAIDRDMPMGKLTRVRDFLPPPSQLAMPEENVKVTLSLTKSSVKFFQRQAHKNHTKYQRMIRELVDRYTHQYKAA